MATHEQTTPTPLEEVMLSRQEIESTAFSLIDDFRKAFRQAPHFSDEVVDKYLGYKAYYPEDDNVITYRQGNVTWDIEYSFDDKSRRLDLYRNRGPLAEELQFDDSIVIVSKISPRRSNADESQIAYCFGNELNTMDIHTNSQFAVNKAREMLADFQSGK